MSVIGDKIKQRRAEAGIALAELARRVDISKGYLHTIENDESPNPSAEILLKIAVELGTTIADLMGQEVSMPELDEMPESLKKFADEEGLPEADIVMLSQIQYRGKRPETENDWRFIYEFIKRTLK